jgi:NhaP-type Na+/H+ and K+/H+ antiporter
MNYYISTGVTFATAVLERLRFRSRYEIQRFDEGLSWCVFKGIKLVIGYVSEIAQQADGVNSVPA